MIDSADLVGIEIGHKSVKALVLSSDATSIMRYAECTLAPADIETASGFPKVSGAIATLWRELGLDLSTQVRIAVAVSHKHAGIGSGPSIETWIHALSGELGQSLTRIGERFEGVSYLPSELITEIVAAFTSLGAAPDRIELPPISAVRAIGSRPTCTFVLGSGVTWQARSHSGRVLEGLVTDQTATQHGVTITKGPDLGILKKIDSVEVDEQKLASLRVTISDIAICAGAAKGLTDSTSVGNLLEGTSNPPQVDPPQVDPAPVAESPPAPAAPQENNFKPLPPQHISGPIPKPQPTAPAVTAQQQPSTQTSPSTQRSGFEPSEEANPGNPPGGLPPISEPAMPASPNGAPQTVPQTNGVATPVPDQTSPPPLTVAETIPAPQPTEETQPGANPVPLRPTEVNPQELADHSPLKRRGKRSSSIEAQRPKIASENEEGFSEGPYQGKASTSSLYNLKLLVITLAIATIAGAALFAYTSNRGNGGEAKSTPVGGDGEVVLALMQADLDDPFEKAIGKGITEKAEEAGTVIETLDAGANANRQLQHVERAISAEVDGIILSPVSATVGAEVVSKASEAKIPVVVVRRPVGGANATTVNNVYPGSSALVTDGDRQLGIRAARFVQENWGTEPVRVINIAGPKDSAEASEQVAGWGSVLSPARIEAQNNVPLLSGPFTTRHTRGWSGSAGEAACKDIALTSSKNILFAVTSELASGCVRGLAESGDISGLQVIAIGGAVNGKTLLEEGTVDALICRKPRDMGASAYESIVEATTNDGESLGYIETPAPVVINSDFETNCIPQW